MPPWPNRLLSPSNPSTAQPPHRHPSPSRLTEADILDQAYGIPTLARSPRRPGSHSHSRSLSHPFPLLFTGRRKAPAAGESTDDDASLRHGHGKDPDKDLVAGKCMTCDSMVRWPRELLVFRCTVCLTINDLRPVVLEAQRGGQRVVRTAEAVRGR
jgi:E3 ubiquitin-protein ligase HECTD2